MALDLLILNPHSAEFYYVPVGTFALCDWLRRKGLSARIVNLSQVPATGMLAHIDRAIAESRPRNVGLILQWKELLPAFLAMGDYIHRTHPDLPIWAGGITAGFYAEDLVARTRFLRGVVRGDSELPMETICRGADPGAVPNLYFAATGGVQSPSEYWWADEAFLDELEYGDLSVLEEWREYLRLLDGRLGIPLAAGRGCAHDCGYCGGSRSAFLLHSYRPRLALRSPASVMRDLQRAFDLGARTFLLTHSTPVCRRILAEIAHRFPRPLPFTLHLELWDPPDEALLHHYVELGLAPGLLPRHVLLSVHGAPTDRARAEERRKLVEATELLNDIDPTVRVTLFSGYFTPWQHSGERLDEELRGAIELRRRFAGRRVGVAMMALSTDPGSRWSLEEESMECDLGLAQIACGAAAERAVINNLLLHHPSQLSRQEEKSFLRAWHLDETLFDDVPVLWSALTAALDYRSYRDLLDRAVRGVYYCHDGRVYPVESDVSPTGISSIVELLSAWGAEGGHRMLLLKELAELHLIAKIARRVRRRGTIKGNDAVLPGFLALNADAVYVSHFDFGPLWAEHARDGMVSERTIEACARQQGIFGYLLLPDVSPAQGEEEMNLLHRFDGVTHTEAVIQALCTHLSAPEISVRTRVFELWLSGVLLGA